MYFLFCVIYQFEPNVRPSENRIASDLNLRLQWLEFLIDKSPGPSRNLVRAGQALDDTFSEVPHSRIRSPAVALTEIDRNLLKRCLAEEPGGWKDFVDRFIGLFIHVIGHVGHSRSVKLSSDDVDDLCAEIFVTLLADDFAILRRFRGQSSLATYLTVIARRIVVKEVSRRRNAEALGHVNAHQSSLDQAHASSAQHVQRIEDADQVELMLRELPERDADIDRKSVV